MIDTVSKDTAYTDISYCWSFMCISITRYITRMYNSLL